MEADEEKKLDQMHVMHSWTVNANLDPSVIKDAEGLYLVYGDGRRVNAIVCRKVVRA